MPRRAGSVPAEVLAEVAQRAAHDAGGVPADLLADYLTALVDAVAAGRPIARGRLRAYRALGDRAARQGVALRALLDLYLSATWRLWEHLPAVHRAGAQPQGVVMAGEVMLHAADDVVARLTEGYQLARRALVRTQESARREFVDDLLAGTADVARVLHGAAALGMDLTGPHAVASIAADRDFEDGMPLVASLERAILGSKGDAQALLASKAGRLVAVFAAPDRAAIEYVTDRLERGLDAAARGRGSMGRWRIGIGRPGTGADGVARSYRESVDALELAERVGVDASVIDARDLLVYQVLLRDRGTLADLVESTLGGLRAARGGAPPLVRTLAAWFAAGGNNAAAARSLHLSVRALTYRLERIASLTGRAPAVPDDRFTLHVATLGAQLLDWPTAPGS